MTEFLRIALPTGLFFISCLIIFLLGFVVDGWAHARRPAGAAEAGARAPVDLARGGDGEGLERAKIAHA